MNIFVGDLQNDKDLELYGYSDNTEQYDENGLPLDGTTGYLNSTDNQLTGNLGDDNGYIYGELNRKVEHQTFTGKETETASTYVNNQSDTIEVNVKKTPKKLTIIDGSLVKTFDGSEDVNIEISSVEGYATKADLEAEVALREQADKDITSKLDTEISNRESADNTLSEALEAETEERILKDNQLQENITNLDTSIPEKVNQILQQGHYVSDENYVHTDNNFTDNDKTELDTLHQMRINDEFGKVDGVAVNDVEQPIENKIVKLTIDKSTVGLDKVDNTSDKDKPVSDAVQLELDSINTNLSSTQTDLSSFKEETNRNISDINSTITSEVTRINQELQTTTNNINTLDGKVDDHINNQNNPHNVTKEQIGLGNVDNTSDLNKPISTQTQTALDGLNQTITNNFNNLNSSIENEIERATLAETEISTKLQQEMNTRVQEHAEIQGKIDTINSKIPNQASSTNQLADKDFVNSTINSSAAFFKGSFKSKAALDAVQWQTTDSSLENYVTNNDYAYIESDETHNNEAWRYIYVKDNTVSEWQPQFRVNESPFTRAQLDAINSGATTDLINSIGSKLTQDAIVDSTGDSSTKAISQRAATLGINTIQSNLNTHILDKNNPHQVTKAQIGLSNVDNTSDLDKPVSTAQTNAINTVQSNLDEHISDYNNPHSVTKAQIGLGNVDNTSDLDKPISTAVRTALNDYLLIANVDSSLNSTSVNPVQNKVLYDPVTFAESERQKSKNLFDYTKIKSLNYGITQADGIFTINTQFYYPSINYDINLSQGETYTFSLNIDSYSNSDGSGVNSEIVLFNANGDTDTKGVGGVNSTGRYSMTFTPEFDVVRVEIRPIRKGNNTSTLTGTVSNLMLCVGEDRDYQPYNGPIVHDKQLNEQLSNYLPLTGGTMSGRIETNGGIRINASGATTATSEYPVDIRRSSSGGDTAIKVTRTDTEKSMYFGIGSGGENRGIYDLTKNSWQLHLDSSDVLHLASFTADGKITIGTGDNKAIQFSKGSYINYIGTSNTIFGIKSATDTVVVGHTSYPIEIRGSNARPLYNDAELALKSDIISSDNFVTIDTAQTITGKKTFNDLISINKNGIRVDIGAENTFGVHLYASAGDFFAFNKKLIPNTTNSLGLGDTSNKWSSLYTNTSVNIGSCTQTYNASTKSLVYSFE